MKKNTLRKLLFYFLFTVIGINFLYSQQMNMKDRFYIGAFNIENRLYYLNNPNDPYWNLFNYSQSNQQGLFFNANHCYEYKINNIGNTLVGHFYDDISKYKDNVNTILSNSFNNGQSLILWRSKVFWPCYGERSTYQAEYNPDDLTSGVIRPGYGYMQRINNIYEESLNGEIIKGVTTQGLIPHTPQHLVSVLYENSEQINDFIFYDRNRTWYIKPRMRIDPTQITDLQMEVARIEIVSYDNVQYQPIILRVINFLKDGSYNGYREIYNFPNQPNQLVVPGSFLNQGNTVCEKKKTDNDSKVDYKVYWSGNIDVWLDYVRVDDEWAHYLFNPELEPVTPQMKKFADRISEEINEFKDKPGFGNYYQDEYEYNNIECIVKTKQILNSITNGKISVLPCFCISAIYGYSLKNFPKFDDTDIDNLINKGLFKDFIMPDNYPFGLDATGGYMYPHNLEYVAPDYHNPVLTDRMHQADNSEHYNYNLQWDLEKFSQAIVSNSYWGSVMQSIRLAASAIKKARILGNDLVYSNVIQAHSFETSCINDPLNGPGNREPTNEEISLQAYLGLVYGAKQIFYYQFQTNSEISTIDGYRYYNFGLVDENATNYNGRREFNVYKYSNNQNERQRKWEYVQNLDIKLRTIGDYMYPPNKNNHLIYLDTRTVNTEPITILNNYPPYIQDTRGLSDLYNASYIKNMISLKRNGTNHEYTEEDVEGSRYWELGFFNPNPQNGNSLDKSKYLFVLNKRCTPETPNMNLYDGDLRKIKLKFKSSELPDFYNWKLIDAVTNNLILTFDKRTDEYNLINVIFQPGEGKLFKLVPVMQDGGTLVCDENVSNVTFICNDMVYSYGKNIIIGNRTNITFKPVAGIHMYNADFTCSYSDGPNNNYISLMPETGSYWEGLFFKNSNVNIQNAVINNNNNGSNPYNYTISGNFCESTNISNCLINLSGNARAISFSKNKNGDDDNIYNDYLMNNIINAYGSDNPVVEYHSTSESINSIMMDGNCFNCQENSGGTAVSLLCYNGVLKNNVINSFNTGVQLNFSSMSFLNNTIQNYGNGQNAVLADALSFVAMGKNGNTLTGGYNSLNISGSEAKILDLSNSSFDIGYGSNDFNLSDIASYDIYGYSPFNISPPLEIDASGNCFYANTYSYSNMDYTNGQGGEQYTFTFNPPTACLAQNPLAIDFIVNLDNGRNDTVYKLINAPQENLSTTEQLVKEVNTDFRKAEFEDVKQNCEQLLTNYTDSIAVIDIIAKLYASTVNLDTNGLLTQDLKTLLEQMILLHPGKIDLIKCAFYYIQKCKVVNEDYLSALQGFQQIMQQNPYDYLGLVASWDYASTMLLMDTTGGTGGSESEQFMMSEDGYIRNLENYFEHYDSFGYDSLKFSKEDRKKIKEALTKTFSDTRKQQTTKFDEVKKLSEKGDEKAKVQVTKMKTLNETVKIKKPKDHLELSKMIHSDMAKVFGNSNLGKVKSNFDLIPDSYSLSQNYPNPFNPSTKINYELPKDGKVKLVIYDILGREMKSLVNNEFKTAGRYTVEFNGSQFASGVYFYRIQVEGGKGFTAVKKMVLVK